MRACWPYSPRQVSLLEISFTVARSALMTSSRDMRTPARSIWGTASAAAAVAPIKIGAERSVTPGAIVLGMDA